MAKRFQIMVYSDRENWLYSNGKEYEEKEARHIECLLYNMPYRSARLIEMQQEKKAPSWISQAKPFS